MKKTLCGLLCAVALSLALPLFVHAQDEMAPILLATEGGVEAWSVPQSIDREGMMATKIVLRTEDESSKIVTFTDINIDGHVRQLHSTLLPAGNALGRPEGGVLFAEEWANYDSHLLINQGDIGGGVYEVRETNDGSVGTLGLNPLATTAAAVAGYGPISTSKTTDAFFLSAEVQSNELDFAYLVSDMSQGPPAVDLTVGVLGAGFIDAGLEGGAYFQNVPVLFQVPEPASNLMALAALLGCTVFQRKRAIK